jgi:hypothetical protein
MMMKAKKRKKTIASSQTRLSFSPKNKGKLSVSVCGSKKEKIFSLLKNNKKM